MADIDFIITDNEGKVVGFGNGGFEIEGNDLELTVSVGKEAIVVKGVLSDDLRMDSITELEAGFYRIEVCSSKEFEHTIRGDDVELNFSAMPCTAMGLKGARLEDFFGKPQTVNIEGDNAALGVAQALKVNTGAAAFDENAAAAGDCRHPRLDQHAARAARRGRFRMIANGSKSSTCFAGDT